jgi:hypothetical protein
MVNRSSAADRRRGEQRPGKGPPVRDPGRRREPVGDPAPEGPPAKEPPRRRGPVEDPPPEEPPKELPPDPDRRR